METKTIEQNGTAKFEEAQTPDQRKRLFNETVERLTKELGCTLVAGFVFPNGEVVSLETYLKISGLDAKPIIQVVAVK